jgi:HlyD family secretion protein
MLMIAIAVAAGASTWAYVAGPQGLIPGRGGRRNVAEKYRLAPVSRTVLEGSLTTHGQLRSAKRTVIECDLERFSAGVNGRSMSAGGASILLYVIPAGSRVKAGDVLATLDSSSYEELLRQQRMTVERSQADHHQGQLELEVAEMAINEYQEGLMNETIQDHQRLIALAESEQARSKDRLDWAGRMNKKGYVSASVLKTEQQTFSKAEIALARARGARDLFERYTSPKQVRLLEGAVLAKRANLTYQDIRLKRNLERLAKLEKQVELCTIRAPHDGYVIYANDRRREVVIEAGMEVRQRQDLFYLPDLKKMEVVAMLHESIVDRVGRGMKARVALEGARGVELTGQVRSVSPIPLFDRRSDVRFFEAIVTIDEDADRRDLMPGMTARVELSTPPKSDVLAVPVEAVTSEEGKDYCYVAREDGEGLERRRIALGEATHDMLEVAEGLEEGERVVLNPRADEMGDDLRVRPESDPAPVAVETPTGPLAALR